MTESPSRWNGSPTERIGGAAVVAEAGGLLVGAMGLIAFGIGGSVESTSAAVFLASFSLAVAAILVWAAYGLAQGRRWPRALIVVWQVMQVSVGVAAWPAAPLIASIILAPVPIALVAVFRAALSSPRGR